MDQSGLAQLRDSEESSHLPVPPVPAPQPQEQDPQQPAGGSPGSPERQRSPGKSKHRSGSAGKSRPEDTPAVPGPPTATSAAAPASGDKPITETVAEGISPALVTENAVEVKEKGTPQPNHTYAEIAAAANQQNASSGSVSASADVAASPVHMPVQVPISSQFTPYVRPSAAPAAPAPASATPAVSSTSTVSVIAPETAGSTSAVAQAPACPEGFLVRQGVIESCKTETAGDASFDQAIVKGAFRMEENVKLFTGSRVVTGAGKEGELVGAFGKMGKCKVKFAAGEAGPLESTVYIFHLPQ